MTISPMEWIKEMSLKTALRNNQAADQLEARIEQFLKSQEGLRLPVSSYRHYVEERVASIVAERFRKAGWVVDVDSTHMSFDIPVETLAKAMWRDENAE